MVELSAKEASTVKRIAGNVAAGFASQLVPMSEKGLQLNPRAAADEAFAIEASVRIALEINRRVNELVKAEAQG